MSSFSFTHLTFTFLEWNRVGLKWIMKVKYWGQFSNKSGVICHVFETLPCFITNYIKEGKTGFTLLNAVTSWNRLPIYLGCFQVRKSWGCSICFPKIFSLSWVTFDWGTLCDVSSFHYSWEDLGVKWSLKHCCMLLVTAPIHKLTKAFCGCWRKKHCCKGSDSVMFISCVVLLPCGSQM